MSKVYKPSHQVFQAAAAAPPPSATSTNNRELLITDLENELTQLQSEWAAVTEYCAEMQQKQQDLSCDLAAIELEEKILTKKLQEIAGADAMETLPEQPEAAGYCADEQQQQQQGKRKKPDDRAPWRALSSAERETVQSVFFPAAPSSSSPDTDANQQATASSLSNTMAFVFAADRGGDDHHHHHHGVGVVGNDVSVTAVLSDPAKMSVATPGDVDVSHVVGEVSKRVQDALEVQAVLTRQKEALIARLHQCGALSVALEAMYLYRPPAM